MLCHVPDVNRERIAFRGLEATRDSVQQNGGEAKKKKREVKEEFWCSIVIWTIATLFLNDCGNN